MGNYINETVLQANTTIRSADLRTLFAALDTQLKAVTDQLMQVGAPIGTVFAFAGTSPPTGFLLCHGQAISRVQYATLFSVIGTTFGAGDGSSSFQVPDLRGRVIAGLDNMGSTSADRLTDAWADQRGGTGGVDKHALSVPELPAHSHGYTLFQAGQVDGSFLNATVTGRQASDVIQTGATGGGQAHNNVQPTMVLQYIIRAAAL